MKKCYTILATAFAFGLVLATPDICITSHAEGLGFDEDADLNGSAAGANLPVDTDMDAYWGISPGSSNRGSNEQASTPSYDAPSYDGGSSNSGSTHTETVYNEAGEAQTVVVSGGGSSYVRPNYTPGSQTSAGKQNFREVVNAGAGTYKVIYCGSEKMTFTLKDADGKAKAADSIALKTLADGRWAINFTVKDAAGCTIGAPLDRTYMYDTLGVSCVTINDTGIIDIAAESAAK